MGQVRTQARAEQETSNGSTYEWKSSEAMSTGYRATERFELDL